MPNLFELPGHPRKAGSRPKWTEASLLKGTRPLLLLIRAVTEASPAPVLLPDLQVAMERVVRQGGDFKGLERFGRVGLFHLLRDLEVSGLIQRSARGYELSERGNREAQAFGEKHRDLEAAIRQVATGLVAA